jgi:hypothetical protein
MIDNNLRAKAIHVEEKVLTDAYSRELSKRYPVDAAFGPVKGRVAEGILSNGLFLYTMGTLGTYEAEGPLMPTLMLAAKHGRWHGVPTGGVKQEDGIYWRRHWLDPAEKADFIYVHMQRGTEFMFPTEKLARHVVEVTPAPRVLA